MTDLSAIQTISDKTAVMKAVSQNGRALQFAAESLKADKDVVMAAVSLDGRALHFAAESLKADKDVVMAAVSQHGRVLELAAESLKADKYVVMAAVRQNGGALQFAAEGLKADKNIVTAAVSQHCKSLSWASKELQRDVDFVRTVKREEVMAFKVVAMSGEHCCVLVDPRDCRDVEAVILRSIAKPLDRDKVSVCNHGHLLHPETRVIHDHQTLTDLGSEQMHDLELVITTVDNPL